jgi:alkaline phosphatase
MKCLGCLAALLTVYNGAALAQNTLPQVNDADFRSAQAAPQERLRVTPNTGRAKNVILFVGDGMGISTVTAGASTRGKDAEWTESRTL